MKSVDALAFRTEKQVDVVSFFYSVYNDSSEKLLKREINSFIYTWLNCSEGFLHLMRQLITIGPRFTKGT